MVAIRDCPINSISLIEKEINKACNKKVVQKYETEPLPGMKKLFEQKQFKLLQVELDAIQSKHNILIILYILLK